MNSDTKGFFFPSPNKGGRPPKLAEEDLEDLRNILELKDRVKATLSELETKGYKREEIAIGFIDGSSPQSTANTVRVWSFDKPHIKNTTRMKANAMGFYPIVGEGVINKFS